MASQIPTSSPPSSDRRSRTWRLLRNVCALLLGGIALICAVAVLARRPLSSWLAERWLAARNVQSAVTVEGIGFHGATARLRLGPPQNPDLTINRAELGFAWPGLAPRIVTVTLDAPALHARYDGRRLDFGQLQNLIGDGAMQAHGLPAAAGRTAAAPAEMPPQPAITVRNAQLKIETASGTLRISGYGDFSEGRVRRLYAAASPVTLRLHGSTIEIAQAIVAKDAGDRVHVRIGGNFTGEGAIQALTGTTLDAEIAGLRWSGAAEGLRIAGRAQARLRAGEVRSGNVSLAGLNARLDLEGAIDIAGAADLRGSLSANGEMPQESAKILAGSIPILGGSAQSRDALVKAMRHVSLAIASLHLLRSPGQTEIALNQPVRLSGVGASLTVSAHRGPLVRAVNGMLSGSGSLQLEGAHLPGATATVYAYRWESAPHGHSARATTAITAHFDYGPIRNGALSGRGTMEWRDGRLAVTLSDCARISAGALVSGRKRIARAASAQICGRNGGPLFAGGDGIWQLAGLWRGLSLRLTAAQTQLSSPQGEIVLQSDHGKLQGHIATGAARLADRAKAQRFSALTLAGRATITNDALAGGFAIAGAGRRRLGRISLHGTLARGRADIRLADLAFQPGGLQPRDLSLLLAPVANAKGSASASARIGWSRRGLTSGGDIAIRGLDFTGPAGRIEGARGNIKLTSLVPLETAPGQTISAAKVAWVMPLTDVTASFALTPQVLRLEHSRATLAHGEVALASVAIPLAAAATRGRITLDRIDLGQLIAASNLAKNVTATGRISGMVPFHYGPDGLSFTDGHVATVTPASLSISRSMWNRPADEAQSTPGAMQDFAYQALEHLAIGKLEGTVNSTPDGRLHLLLHIKGHYAPAELNEAEVGLFALLQGTAFDKPVPLPAGTQVNLTLDTSLNFAELLAAYRKAWADSTGRAAP